MKLLDIHKQKSGLLSTDTDREARVYVEKEESCKNC